MRVGQKSVGLLLAMLFLGGAALGTERLVFGSFEQPSKAEAFAMRLRAEMATVPIAQDIAVATVSVTDSNGVPVVRYRVVTQPAPEGSLEDFQALAAAQGFRSWVWPGTDAVLGPLYRDDPYAGDAPMPGTESSRRPTPVRTETEFDLGLQSRAYARPGQQAQSRWQLSVSGLLDFYVASDSERHSLTVSPFFRVDGEDSERSHVDLREGYYSYIGERFELHLGARQIFWGVTEFKHLVDVINQTDLVENIDAEDKLGQPLLQLSMTRDWGVLSLFLLAGSRKRTFPGEDGRLRFGLPIAADSAAYESGADGERLDGAIRWSHFAGPLSWGVYHFSGTNREPLLLPRQRAGALELLPYYAVIDQTGLDLQYLVGDWAFKLEAISRTGDRDRYAAANLGFERTLVGFLGSRSDVGLVVEYLFDERGDDAHNTLFERDLALGLRWSFNDPANTQALFGVVWDTQTNEYLLSLEASRQLGDQWQLALEGRAFGGAEPLPAQLELLAFVDGSAKSAFLQDDDFLQLELTRYF